MVDVTHMKNINSLIYKVVNHNKYISFCHIFEGTEEELLTNII